MIFIIEFWFYTKIQQLLNNEDEMAACLKFVRGERERAIKNAINIPDVDQNLTFLYKYRHYTSKTEHSQN